MTKHSSRLILKIPYFIISSVNKLVLRNKIRFVARVHVEHRFNNSSSGYCTESEMFFSSPSGYSFRFSVSSSSDSVLGFLFQHPLLLRSLLEILLEKYMFFY